MKTKIGKPPLPLIFLDTFFFVNLVHDRHSISKGHHYREQLVLIDLIHKLTKQKKALCPIGNQEEEYELGKYESEIREEQVKLAHGISVIPLYSLKRLQTQIAIEAYIKNLKQFSYGYQSLFHSDLMREMDHALSQSYLVDVRFPTPSEWVTKRRKIKSELANEFEQLRKEKRINNIKFREWVKQEQLGTYYVILNTIKNTVPKISRREALTENENNGLQILSEYFSDFVHYSKKNPKADDILEFLKSDYHKTIPHIDIQSGLLASLLTQTGQVKETDNFDFNQASQMLPFTRYFLTDNSLKHRLSTRPLSYDKKYGVKIYSMREISSLIKDLSKL